ncbi:MAG TPA: tyrosine-type recombinase/integrase [Anaerolineales bacterium]|nr:tyrosine-type recombinase/integrase [Anaerolineales bacterium]
METSRSHDRDEQSRADGEEPGELLRLVFGEQAGKATHTAGERLMRWSEAFERWLGEAEAKYGLKRRKEWRKAWEGFLQHCNKVPWEAVSGDVEGWINELVSSRLNPNTIYRKLRALERFYDHCANLGLETTSGSNPARGVERPKMVPRLGHAALSAQEAGALLGAIDRETDLVAKRDYALLLMHLTTGLKSNQIRKLRWEELQLSEEGRCTYIGEHGRLKVHLPEVTWQAIREYLEASGRWGEMEAGDYVFAPVVDPLNRRPSGKAEDWNRHRPLSMDQMHFLLRRYASWAGFQPGEVTYHSLRHTALMLQIEAGDERGELRNFMLGMGDKAIRRTIRFASEGARRRPLPETNSRGEAKEPYRRGKSKAQPGNQMALKHGFYATRLPDELAALVEDSSAQGFEEEILILRAGLRQLFRMIMETDSPKDAATWLDLFGENATRLANLLKLQRNLELKQEENAELEEAKRRFRAWGGGEETSEGEVGEESV